MIFLIKALHIIILVVTLSGLAQAIVQLSSSNVFTQNGWFQTLFILFWFAVSIFFLFTGLFKSVNLEDFNRSTKLRIDFLVILGFANLILLVIYNYTECDL